MNVMVNFGFFYYIIELFFFQGGIIAQYTYKFEFILD